MSPLESALDRWRVIVGAANVVTDDHERAAAGRATFALAGTPNGTGVRGVPAIVRPARTDEVAACVRVAADLGVPLYAISRGRNWGFGSRAPTVEGTVLIDLGRMDRIVDFDARMAHVTVEPGVSFAQLHRFLLDQRAPLFASMTGGSPDGSVLGNALERGDGAGPLGDRVEHACALEVVLPTGEVIRTGYAARTTARSTVAPLARAGVGPSLDGLFAQSRLGIVTRMTVWLAPLPAYYQCAHLRLDEEGQLSPTVEALRSLRLRGVVRAPHALWNHYRALAQLRRYPWREADEATPLVERVMAPLRAEAGIGRWNGALPLFGASREQGMAERRLVEEALAPLCELDWEEHDAPGPEHVGGAPSEGAAASLYWRKRGPLPPTLDPDSDGVGLLWATAAVPFAGEHATRACALARDELRAHGFEPQLVAGCLTERLIRLVVSISWDRSVDGEDARASACHDALADALEAAGYPPFRLGLQSMARVSDGEEESTRALHERIARALDPADILSPGRYDVREKG